MSSRNGDGPADEMISPAPPKSWSIIWKLTRLFTLSTIGMLLVYAAIMHWALIDSLAKEDMNVLAEKVDHLCVVLRNRPDSFLELQNEFDWEEGHPLENVKRYVRILDDTGRTLAKSPSFDKIGSAPPFPTTARSTLKWDSPDGRLLFLMTTLTEDSLHPGKWRTVQVAMDVTDEKLIIVDYHRKLLSVLVIGVFLSAGVGFIVARSTLRPLEKITRVAERITAELINEQIDPSQWPKEMASLTAAFNSMLKRLKDSFERLNLYSSDLAHEIRTPINNMMGESEIAISRDLTGEAYRKVLGSNLEEMARLSRLVDSLLFLARAENPQTHIEISRFDAYDEVKKICAYFRLPAEEQGVEMICSGNGVLKADPLLVNRAVSNLVSNALHHTPPAGKIEVTIHKSDGHSLEITVSDTGPGITAEHLHHIFDRFYRGDDARSNYPQGSGLGLAIVKSIMALHGGAVDIRSEQGRGTLATLRFPGAETSEEEPLQE